MANNKVKFNLWNVYYAPLLTNTTSKIEYGTPIAIPGCRFTQSRSHGREHAVLC